MEMLGKTEHDENEDDDESKAKGYLLNDFIKTCFSTIVSSMSMGLR